MPSSTSSSEPALRAPEASWGRTWALAALIVGLLLVGFELMWRDRGLVPVQADDGHRWLDAVHEVGTDGVVLVGSSRTVLGVDPEILHTSLRTPVHQLSINGGNPIEILDFVAEELVDFEGIVLVEFMPSRYFAEDARGVASSLAFIRVAGDPSLVAGVEHNMRKLLTARLTILAPHTTTLGILRSLVSGDLPSHPARVMRIDRFMEVDADRIDGQPLDRRWAGRLREIGRVEDGEAMATLTRVRDLRVALERQGARVMFFRVPSDGATGQAEAELFPRDTAYETAREVIGGDWWHYKDDGFDFRCFDGSHLHPDDVPSFTRALATAVTNPSGVPDSDQ